jgi:hypothetical protein
MGSAVKHRVEPPPTIKYCDDRTEIVWKTATNHKIQSGDIFEFQW